MATNLLMPISPNESSPTGINSSGGQFTGKYFKSNSRNQKATSSSAKGNGSLTRKAQSGLTRTSAPQREAKANEKKVARDIDPQRCINLLFDHKSRNNKANNVFPPDIATQSFTISV